MEQNADRLLSDWADSIRRLELIPWSSFPELDLYMDQVITLMNRQLEPLYVDSDRPLTPSMINNYVKDGVMPRPSHKKYTREHLTILSLICMLKPEFTLPEIRTLVTALSEFYSTEELYNAFCEAQATHLRDAAEQLTPLDDMSEAERYRLAMELALEANAKRIAAARLLSSLSPQEDAPEDKKEKDKKEKKEKKKKKDNTEE